MQIETERLILGEISYQEERLSADEYIDFLKRTDLGSQYPKERFYERIGRLVENVSISLVARNENDLSVNVLHDKQGYFGISCHHIGNLRYGILLIK